MKTSFRLAVSIHGKDDDSSVTLLKPFSDEYNSSLFVISEDAYGEIGGELTNFKNIIIGAGLSVKDFKELLSLLNIKETETTRYYERFCEEV